MFTEEQISHESQPLAPSGKAIVIGASSGIGRALAKELAANGYEIGLASRRTALLEKLQKEIPSTTHIKKIDISEPSSAQKLLGELIAEMGGADIIVINSGISVTNKNFRAAPELETLAVNVAGFTAMTNVAVNYFLSKGAGHLVGISSIAGIRGSAVAPAYNASKAFVSNYLEGMRQKLNKTKISVTDIRPGFIDTPLIKNHKWAFWRASPERAAEFICAAIKRKKKVAYVPKRWWFVAQFMKILPEFLYNWGYNRIFGEETGGQNGKQRQSEA
ncbi:MAG: SDR family NAD(P)-dependent oxidoreductase [Elusimicrobiota bacterium]|nr:SDR family NAD(P)-dependent oxidoreductase [Elusimicrobiota bacterium]